MRWGSNGQTPSSLGEFGEPSCPASLLIGVKPKSLADEDTNTVAYRCLDILKEFDITDIGVEIGKSISWQ